jgi:hypothetical protein
VSIDTPIYTIVGAISNNVSNITTSTIDFYKKIQPVIDSIVNIPSLSGATISNIKLDSYPITDDFNKLYNVIYQKLSPIQKDYNSTINKIISKTRDLVLKDLNGILALKKRAFVSNTNL